MSYDPNNSIVVGGHPDAYDANGAKLMAVQGITAPVATLAALKGLGTTQRSNGTFSMVLADGSKWRFASASTLTGDDLLVVTPTDAPSAGRWLRADSVVDLVLPCTFSNADGSTLYTVPAGFKLALLNAFWEVTTSWTGGSSSAIGVASSNAGLSTAGDILGGASGDVLATLVSTGAFAKGTVGAKMGKPGAVIVGADTITFERITSAFTAGAGNVHVVAHVLVAPAA